MEVWIAANILMTLASQFRPNHAYQMTDVGSTIERTVTSRPIVFGTVYDQIPSTSETPFKPSKQLFDQIATTEKPPPGDIGVISEPANTRMEPSEALHINLFTLPTDSLNYNLLLGQDVQQSNFDPKYSKEPVEMPSDGPNEDVAENKPAKKEVHYHQHQHFHGYVPPNQQQASDVQEHYHENKKIPEDREHDYEPSHSNDEEHEYRVPENVPKRSHDMKEKQEEYHRGYVSEPEVAKYEDKNEDSIYREHSHMPEHGAVYKYRVSENGPRRSHRKKEKQEERGYVSEPENEHSHVQEYRVSDNVPEHSHKRKKKQGEHHIGYVGEPGEDSYKHINEHSHVQVYRVPDNVPEHSHRRKEKQPEHHLGYVSEPGGDIYKDLKEHSHIQEHEGYEYRFHDNVPERSHRRKKKQEKRHRGYDSERDEDDYKHVNEHYQMHEHQDDNHHERIPGERRNKSESSRRKRRKNLDEKRNLQRNLEDYPESNVHKRRRHNKQKSSSQPIVVKVREEYKLRQL